MLQAAFNDFPIAIVNLYLFIHMGAFCDALGSFWVQVVRHVTPLGKLMFRVREMAASTKNLERNVRFSDKCVPRARDMQMVALRGLALSSFGLFLHIVCEWRTFID